MYTTLTCRFIVFRRRPKVSETVLPQRSTLGPHHAVLQNNATLRSVPGTRGHHNGCLHANGVAAVGLACPRKRARQ